MARTPCFDCAYRRESTRGPHCEPCLSEPGPHFTNWTPMAHITTPDDAGPAVQRANGVPSPAGRKDDAGKLDVTLFFDDLPHAIEAVTEVLQWAVTKKQPAPYERGSWQQVTDFQRRYRGAHLRHQLNAAKAVKAGTAAAIEQARDHETGLLELAHIATDAMFMLEKAIRTQKGFE